jgi:hypothetical protein
LWAIDNRLATDPTSPLVPFPSRFISLLAAFTLSSIYLPILIFLRHFKEWDLELIFERCSNYPPGAGIPFLLAY